MITIKHNKRAQAAAAGVACAIFVTTLFAALSPMGKASAFDGDFDSGTFDVWDGTTYDFSWYEGKSSPYSITSAAQFATLSILTNDLTHDDYEWFRSHLPDTCTPYLATKETFEGDEINLLCDVDMGAASLVPIAYVFSTPNITYDMYPALEHVPTDLTAVDPWVGDENGNKINTRYLEMKYAEMRYRDLLYYYDNPDVSPNELKTTTSESTRGGIGFIYYWDAGYNTYDTNTGLAVHRYDYKAANGRTANDNYKSTSVSLRPMEVTDIPMSYVYADVADYADGNKFKGTFNGNNKRVKNFSVSAPYTTDARERAYTFDSLGNGLFSYLDTDGVIKNLNIWSANPFTTLSYSALLCAYNYGTIENCYVKGEVTCTTYNSIYPIYRDYGPDGTSTYVYSTAQGAVLPVGNSGFVTAWNKGTIKDCTTDGKVSSAFRQFGFMTCTNYGTIEGCTNKATFSDKEVRTNFQTDEWSYTYSPTSALYTSSTHITIPQYFRDKHEQLHTVTASKEEYWNAIDPSYVRQYDEAYSTVAQWPGLSSSKELSVADDVLSHSCAIVQGLSSNGAFVPALYNTAQGESIAANHLYGVYALTCVGGICVTNYGTITDCTNTGNIQTMFNTSTRKYGNMIDDTETSNIVQGSLSYIRPTTALGIFSTQLNTHAYAAGITVYNFGTLTNVKNTGNITHHAITDRDANDYTVYSGDDPTGIKRNGYKLLFTKNGFYTNDSYIYDKYDSTEDYVYNPLGLRWWVPGDLAADEDISEYNFITEVYYTGISQQVAQGKAAWTLSPAPTESDCYTKQGYSGLYYKVHEATYKVYDPVTQNMPYPAYGSAGAEGIVAGAEVHEDSAVLLTQLTSGICIFSTGNIDTAENSGKADCGITYISKALGDECINVKNVIQSGECKISVGFCFYDTNIENVEVTDAVAINAVVTTVTNKFDAYIKNIQIYSGKNLFESITATKDLPTTIERVYDYDKTLAGGYISKNSRYVNISDIVSVQNMVYGFGDIYCGSIKDLYLYGTNSNYATFSGSQISLADNINYFGGTSAYPLYMHGDVLSNVKIYITTDGETLAGANHCYTNIRTVKDVDIVLGIPSSTIFSALDSDIDNLNVYANGRDRTSDNGGYFNFSGCTVHNAVLQCDVPFKWLDIEKQGMVQSTPQMLKQIADTNKFDTVVVQLPYGVMSYGSYNFMYDIDNTIMSDAKLVYNTNARESGALAYYMDHGDSSDRTYDYTVAQDTYDIVSILPEAFDKSKVEFNFTEVKLPLRTRHKVDDSEDSYYKISVPYNGAGMGEISASCTVNGTAYSTKAMTERFPETDLFVKTGTTVDLTTITTDGYGLTKATLNYSDGTSTELNPKEVTGTVLTVDDRSMILDTVWKRTYTISTISDNVVNVKVNCTAAVPGTTVYITPTLLSSNYVLDGLYYYNYYKDSNNLWVLDPTKNVIDMNLVAFTMPENPVEVHASYLKDFASIDDFVLEGVHGDIIDETNTINIYLDGSVDLTSLTVQSITAPDAKAINPSIDTEVDFSRPVIYTLECESGRLIDYVVLVHGVDDGFISYFNWMGYTAKIDQELNTITLDVPEALSLIGEPSIGWRGSNLSFDDSTSTYTVTSTSGNTRDYTLTINRYTSETPLDALSILVPDVGMVDFSIDHDTKTATVNVPYGADVSTVMVSALQSNSDTTSSIGTILNLTKRVYITVIDDLGNFVNYKLQVSEIPSSTKVINQFTLFGIKGDINEETHEIHIVVPVKYDIRAVSPDVVSFTGQSLSNAYEAHDFTVPVEYTVKAYDGTEVTYTVTTERSTS